VERGVTKLVEPPRDDTKARENKGKTRNIKRKKSVGGTHADNPIAREHHKIPVGGGAKETLNMTQKVSKKKKTPEGCCPRSQRKKKKTEAITHGAEEINAPWGESGATK